MAMPRLEFHFCTLPSPPAVVSAALYPYLALVLLITSSFWWSVLSPGHLFQLLHQPSASSSVHLCFLASFRPLLSSLCVSNFFFMVLYALAVQLLCSFSWPLLFVFVSLSLCRCSLFHDFAHVFFNPNIKCTPPLAGALVHISAPLYIIAPTLQFQLSHHISDARSECLCLTPSSWSLLAYLVNIFLTNTM